MRSLADPAPRVRSSSRCSPTASASPSTVALGAEPDLGDGAIRLPRRARRRHPPTGRAATPTPPATDGPDDRSQPDRSFAACALPKWPGTLPSGASSTSRSSRPSLSTRSSSSSSPAVRTPERRAGPWSRPSLRSPRAPAASRSRWPATSSSRSGSANMTLEGTTGPVYTGKHDMKPDFGTTSPGRQLRRVRGLQRLDRRAGQADAA